MNYKSLSTSSFFNDHAFLGELLTNFEPNDLKSNFFIPIEKREPEKLRLPFQGPDHQGVKIIPPYIVVMKRESIHSFHSTPAKLYPRL